MNDCVNSPRARCGLLRSVYNDGVSWRVGVTKYEIWKVLKVPKKKGPNKTQAIKDYMRENPDAGPKRVAEALTKQGIKVSAQYVSTIKSLHKRRLPSAKSLEDVDIPLSAILAAKKLAEEVGGVEKARAAVEALEMLS